MKRTHKQSRGFTLIEALVALTILTVGLVPAFIQARSALNLSGSIRNSLIAANLAQEGAEIARSLRDEDWFATRPFGQSLADCATGCELQWDSGAQNARGGFVTNAIGNGVRSLPMRLDPATGLYQYTEGDPSPYRRIVTVTPVSRTELRVEVVVQWDEASGQKQYVIEDHLFDWLQ